MLEIKNPATLDEQVDSLTPDEIMAFREQQKRFEEQQKEFKRAQLDAHATATLKNLGASPDIKKFIWADNEAEITRKAQEFVSLIEREAEKRAVEKARKYTSGYNSRSFDIAPDVNPFAKETFNMTAQAKLFRENPIEARRLAAAAGVSLNW